MLRLKQVQALLLEINTNTTMILGMNHSDESSNSLNRERQSLLQQVERRRTFAIISHPDAGKTTLTEKLLLYSGMTRTAGMVRARKGGKQTMSDWMALEQERGISISASAMQFTYKNAIINLLDTPGHQDFSEDTYRTLTAADSAVMVLDASRGVEAQTRKLFAVCRMRGIPVLTLINKMDLPARDPLDLLHEVEEVLKIQAAPVNWPIGSGREFSGVIDMRTRVITLFQKSEQGGALRAQAHTLALEEFLKDPPCSTSLRDQLRDDLELLEGAGNSFSRDEFLSAQVTPVFFASALTNFGIEPFFDELVTLAPAPGPVPANASDGSERKIDPVSDAFSAYVFKIQSNMNPKHRDSIAFIRVCSGQFERDMLVQHARLKKEIRLSRSFSLVAKDRDTVDTAFAGDIVGLSNPGIFQLGDTISVQKGFTFPALPEFAPEMVARIRPLDVMKRKSFDKGIDLLSREGTIHLITPASDPLGTPLIGAVGKLQFEVSQYRLEDEYGVRTALDILPYSHCVLVEGDPNTLQKTQSSLLARDARGRLLLLYEGVWEKGYLEKNNPNHRFVSLGIEA